MEPNSHAVSMTIQHYGSRVVGRGGMRDTSVETLAAWHRIHSPDRPCTFATIVDHKRGRFYGPTIEVV